MGMRSIQNRGRRRDAVLSALATVAAISAVAPAPLAAAAPVAAVQTDQPCTRVGAEGSPIVDVRYRPDDVAWMVLPKSAYGSALSGYSIDWMHYGYLDNAEVHQVELAPPGTCESSRSNGRITGFSGAYERWSTPYRYVGSSVSLFFDAGGAYQWVKTFTYGMRQQVGRNGISRVDVRAVPSLGSGAVRLDIRAASGLRSWVLFPRGNLVGSVIDFRSAGAQAVDVNAFAGRLASRMASGAQGVASRARDPLDAPVLTSMPLKKGWLGSRYGTLTWDWFFGGCTDAQEAASQSAVPADELADAARYRRLSGCYAMYRPPANQESVNGVRAISTQVVEFATPSGASGYLWDALADANRVAGTTRDGTAYGRVYRFAPGTLGDEAAGWQQSVGGGVQTQIVFRDGRLLGRVVLATTRAGDAVAEVRRIAPMLDARITRLLQLNA